MGRRWLCCLVLAASPQVLAQAGADGARETEERDAEASDLDWVPAEALTEAQKATLPTGCCGAY
ncbi:hypothetical protein, partial [Marinimicrobium sp. UBA4509]|uniref:hypothetical protein n=1 Tax=Marinimicrobium sp. UBA4509 TaxID=1946811 RepID=UPI00257A5D4E